eukprot:SAG31_NODE_3867_length_3800_cov_23.537422_5_plen_211_part_00
MEWITTWATTCPYHIGNEVDHFVSLALLCLDLLGSKEDESLPEGVIVGAGQALCWMTMGKQSVAKSLWGAGFLAVFQGTMARYNPMEMVLMDDLIPSATFFPLKDVVEGAQAAGIDVIQPLVDAGAVDVAISALVAYQVCGHLLSSAFFCFLLLSSSFFFFLLLSSELRAQRNAMILTSSLWLIEPRGSDAGKTGSSIRGDAAVGCAVHA